MNDIDDDAPDELTLRYRRASTGDPSRPSQHTREAISAQARKAMTLRSPRAADEAALAQLEASPSANDSRWNMRAVAGLAVVGLAGLLATQAFHQAPKPGSPAAEVVTQAIAPAPAAFPSDEAPRDAVLDAPLVASRPDRREMAAKASTAQTPAERDRFDPVGGSATARAQPLAAPTMSPEKQSGAASRSMEMSLEAARDAMNAKKFDEALDLLKRAQALPDKSSADSQYLTRDKADRYKVLARLAYAQKNYPSAAEWGNKAISAGDNSEDLQLIVAQSYFLQNKYKEAAVATQRLVSRAESAGQQPGEASLKLLWECYRKTDDDKAESRVIEKLLTYYPKPDYWANATASLQQMPNRDDRLTLQTYRLMQDVGTLKRSDQYAEMAQLANEQNFPGESEAVLEEGMAKNVFTEQRDKERVARLLEAAQKLAVTARQGLPREEQAAAVTSSGEALVAVGSSYLLNANDPVKAVPLITQGIGKGGLTNVNDAYINLGLAQARNKNVAEAQKVFGKVDNDAGYERLARLWLLRLH